jgi:hypothetical protein
MRHHRRIGVVVFALVLLTLPVANAVVASAPSAAPSLPLSPLEQAARLSGLASQALGRALFPHPPEAIAPTPYFQRDYRIHWLSASPYEWTRLAEKIGNQGRARFAAEQGWSKILGSQARGIVQGPDAVYWDSHSGRVRALEAKGGTSQVKWTHSSLQGTNTNTIWSAEWVLKSAKASPAEKLAAARVIKAAQQNRLQTGVVKTSHVLGKPDTPRLEGQWDRASVSKEAFEIERRLVRQNPEL